MAKLSPAPFRDEDHNSPPWQRWFSEIIRAVNDSGTLTDGSTTITKYLSAEFTVDFGSIAANDAVVSAGLTLTGAVVSGSIAMVQRKSGASTLLSYTAEVTGADEVKIIALNATSGAIDPASGVFRVSVIQH